MGHQKQDGNFIFPLQVVTETSLHQFLFRQVHVARNGLQMENNEGFII